MSSAIAAVAVSLLLPACASKRTSVYEQEQFASSNQFAHHVAEPSDESCAAARRALMSQGYIVDMSRPDALTGRKRFQPGGEDHVEIDFNVVCMDTPGQMKASEIFVSATQDLYRLKKTSNSASVGVGPIGSVSLPVGYTDDSLVKVGSATIPAGPFYERFFKLVEHYLASRAPGASLAKEAVESGATAGKAPSKPSAGGRPRGPTPMPEVIPDTGVPPTPQVGRPADTRSGPGSAPPSNGPSTPASTGPATPPATPAPAIPASAVPAPAGAVPDADLTPQPVQIKPVEPKAGSSTPQTPSGDRPPGDAPPARAVPEGGASGATHDPAARP